MSAYEPSLFEKLLRVCLPKGGFVVSFAQVFLDESGTHDDTPVLCVAGYIFTEKNAVKFNAEMLPVYKRFGIEYYHTNEVLGGKFKKGGKGHFDHLTDKDRDKLSRIMIKSIKRRAVFGFAATVKKDEYAAAVKGHSTMPTAYGFCIFQAFIHVRKWIEKTGFDGDIAYILEDGADDKGDATTFLRKEVLSTEKKRKIYCYKSFTLMDKKCGPTINAPDVLSYHWWRYHHNRINGKEPRKDLLALVEGDKCKVADWASSNMQELREVLIEMEPEMATA